MNPLLSVVERKLQALPVTVQLVLPDGAVLGAPEPRVRFVAHDKAALAHLAEGAVGILGQDYVEGRIDIEGNMRDVMAAAAALPPADRARVLLMVAGDPPSEAKLARVRELGMIDQVRFPGLLDDVRPALAACDAGFVLSYREALSFACREIMGLGLPALISDVGGLPENVTDGEDGWIVPVRDVPAMTARLRFMLDNPQAVRAMGARARETAVRDFNLARFADATLDVYRRALG